jgi:hypothetical protein
VGALDQIAEQRILAAQRRGDFDALPGTGRPLDLSEDLMIPAEVRTRMRLMRNAGVVPPEVADLRALASTEVGDDSAHGAGRVEALLNLLEQRGLGLTARAIVRDYRQRVLERIDGRS